MFIGTTYGQDDQSFELPPGFSYPYYDDLQTPEERAALATEAENCLFRMYAESAPEDGEFYSIKNIHFTPMSGSMQ